MLFSLVDEKQVVGRVNHLLNLHNPAEVVRHLELHNQDEDKNGLDDKLSELRVWQRVEEGFTSQVERHLS